MINEVVAKRIKDYLDSKGIKKIWLSRQTKINWSDRLSGRVQIKVEDIYKAANVLDIPISTFIDN